MFDASAVNKAREAIELDQRPHDARDTELLYRIYMDKRIHSQIKFYESRVRENQLNADFTFSLGTLVMTLSSLVATISASVNLPFLSLMAAIFPAFAALLGSFRQLYGWERQSNIYRDALMGLERVKLLSPDDDRMAAADLTQIYPRLIVNGEAVFTGEVNQWGQFVQSTEAEAVAETSDSKVYNALVDDLQGRSEKVSGMTDEQINTIKSILAAGKPTAFDRSELLEHEEAIVDPVPAQAVMVTPATAKTWPPALPDMDLPGAVSSQPAIVETSNNNHHDEAPPPEQEEALAPGALHVEAVEAKKDDGLFG